MVSSTLREYVDECASQHCALVEVRQTLLSTGWPTSEVDEALLGYGGTKVTLPTESIDPQPLIKFDTTKTPRRLGWMIGTFIGVLLLAAIIPTAFAEQGYLPGFSLVYKSLNLPVFWGGLPGSPSLAVAESVKVVSSLKAVSLTSKTTFTLSQGNQAASTKTINDSLNKEVSLLKNGDNLQGRSLADVPAACTTACAATQDYAQYLPLRLSSTVILKSDQNNNSDITYSLDLSSLLTKIPSLKTVLNNLSGVLTAEVATNTITKTAFYRSTILPYKTGDQGKWFSYSVAALPAQKDLSTQDIAKSLSPTDLKNLSQIVDSLFVDQGVERVNAIPEAHFQAIITQAKLAALKKQYPTNALLNNLDFTPTQNAISFQLDIWIGEFDHLPYRLKLNDSLPVTSTYVPGLNFQITSDNTFSYQNVIVPLPVQNQIISGSVQSYISQACGLQTQATASPVCSYFSLFNPSSIAKGIN